MSAPMFHPDWVPRPHRVGASATIAQGERAGGEPPPAVDSGDGRPRPSRPAFVSGISIAINPVRPVRAARAFRAVLLVGAVLVSATIASSVEAAHRLHANDACEPAWVPNSSDAAGPGGSVRAMTVWDDGTGSGPGLFVGGMFTTAGGMTVNRVAKWDGASWSPLDSGMSGTVFALTVFDDGSGAGAALHAGGSFDDSPAGDAYLATWQGCPVSSGCVTADLDCDGIVDGTDLGLLLSAWGPCAVPGNCPADLNGDGVVDGADLGILLFAWSN